MFSARWSMSVCALVSLADTMECVLKHFKRTDPKLFIGCRYNHGERSWGGSKKVGHRGSAEECIAHIRNRHSKSPSAEDPQIYVVKKRKEEPNILAVPAKRDS